MLGSLLVVDDCELFALHCTYRCSSVPPGVPPCNRSVLIIIVSVSVSVPRGLPVPQTKEVAERAGHRHSERDRAKHDAGQNSSDDQPNACRILNRNHHSTNDDNQHRAHANLCQCVSPTRRSPRQIANNSVEAKLSRTTIMTNQRNTAIPVKTRFSSAHNTRPCIRRSASCVSAVDRK